MEPNLELTRVCLFYGVTWSWWIYRLVKCYRWELNLSFELWQMFYFTTKFIPLESEENN